jgi:uncharacterized membrane protein YheB (UPF0754 family)
MLSSWVFIIGTPLIGAFIGWVTTWLGIKMLFRPRREMRILGMRVQGVFPKRQALLAEKLGEVVAEELISVREITSRMQSGPMIDEISKILDQRLDVLLWEKLPQAMPMLAMVMSPGLAGKVKEVLRQDLQPMIGTVLGSVGNRLVEEVDIREIVRRKVEALSPARVEELLLAIMKKQLKFIEFVAGVLGFVIGVGQVVLTIYS